MLSMLYLLSLVGSVADIGYLIVILTITIDGRLMPEPDYPAVLIGCKSGHQRNNRSWIIGRLLRDHVNSQDEALERSDGTRNHEALRIMVFRPSDDARSNAGVPEKDSIWWTGIGVILVQLALASIPWIVSANWSVFLVTAAGTVLALLQTANPQWPLEKWGSSTTAGWTISITQGNGSRHVLVVLGKDHIPSLKKALDLEILASQSNRFVARKGSKCIVALMAALWIALLITATGVKSDTWCKSYLFYSCILC